ncbi:Uncharacterized protein FKW44_014169, partial [Caligus rogercresseyi]
RVRPAHGTKCFQAQALPWGRFAESPRLVPTTNVNQYVCTTYKRYECVNTCLDGRRTPRSVFSRIIEGKKRLFKRFVNGLTSKKSVPSSPAPPPSRSNGIDYQWKSNPGLVSKINSNYGRRPLPPSPPRRAPSAQRTPSTQRSCSNQRRQECRYVPYREACAFQPVKNCQSVPERECQISCSNIWVCCGSTTTTGGVRPPTVTGVRPPTVTGPPAPPVQPGPPAPPTDINVIVGPPAPGILEDDDEDDGDFVVIEAA